MTQRFRSAWDALDGNPKDAANMRLRAALVRGLQKHLRDHNLTQNDAAILFGVSQTRVSDLMRGNIDLFSVDMLPNMAAKANLDILIQVREAA